MSFDLSGESPPVRTGMGAHQSPASESEVWLTPPGIIEALGPFDLDPCAAPEPRPWDTAKLHYTRADGDGLLRPWLGRVWLNPPYGPPNVVTPWVKRLAEHGVGTALIFARTETEMFHDYCWDRADAMLFLRGRLHFHRPDGSRAAQNAGAPSVLVAYGMEDAYLLAKCGLTGHSVILWPRKKAA